MIELFINNQELILPEDFSVTMVEENPEITNNGVFTLDITVSLLEAKNAIAFGFLNRLNIETITNTAMARFVINGIVKNGKIIVSQNTNIDVTFQFIAGNSQMNYNMRTDARKIWELNWGQEAEIDYNKALDSITNPDNYNFVCAPVSIGGLVYNNYTVTQNTLIKPVVVSGVERILMQPYLKYFINRLPSLLGFNLNYNILDSDNRLKYMYFINVIQTLKYSDTLPDITVSEFIIMIENYFNVFFICDTNKNLSIENQKSLKTKKQVIKLENVLDSYVRSQNETKIASRYGFSRIAYELPSSNFFKYQNIDEAILAKCQLLEFNTWTDLMDSLQNEIELNLLKIWKFSDFEYFYGSPNAKMYAAQMWLGKLNLINRFKPHGTNKDAELVLKFVPAEMGTLQQHWFWNLISGQQVDATVAVQLPKANNSYFIQTVSNFVDTVEKDNPKIPRTNTFQVALYSGKLKMYNTGWSFASGKLDILYPFSHIDTMPSFCALTDTWPEFEEIWKNTVWTPAINTTLRIEGENGIYQNYKLESTFDPTKEYSFIVPDSPNLSTKCIFDINNKKYIPISIEKELSYKQKTVTIKCYAVL